MYLPFSTPGQMVAELRAAAPADALWLLCLSDRHGEALAELLAALRAGGLRACGGIFPGLIQGGRLQDAGLVAVPLPAASRATVAELAPAEVRWRGAPPEVPAGQAASAYLFVDCLAPNITGFLEGVFDRYGSRLSHVGAGAGYRDLRREPALFTEAGLLIDGALLIVTPQAATVQVRHGWTRIEGPFVASRTRGNVIEELNWEPAGSFYRRLVGAHQPQWAGKPIFPDVVASFPLCIGKDGGEDVMRDPVGINDADELVVLSHVSENSVMYLAHGDRASLVAAARQAVDDCGDPAGVVRCFVSDCYSRARFLADGFDAELDAVADAVARFADVAPEGVLALGEIAANGRSSIEFFNKTIVVGLTHG